MEKSNLYESVIDHFRTISKILCGSGNEQAIAEYLVEFAKGLGRTWPPGRASKRAEWDKARQQRGDL